MNNRTNYANFVAILSYPFMLVAAFLVMVLGMSLLLQVKNNFWCLSLTFLLFVAIVAFVFFWGKELFKAIQEYRTTKVFPFAFQSIRTKIRKKEQE